MFANNNKCLQYLVKQNETFIYMIFGFRLFFSEQNLIFFPTTVTRKMSKSNACMIFKQTKYSKTQSNQFRKDF